MFLAASDDFTDVVNDPEFLQNVLESLPGVDPNSEPIRSAVSALANVRISSSVKNTKNSFVESNNGVSQEC